MACAKRVHVYIYTLYVFMYERLNVLYIIIYTYPYYILLCPSGFTHTHTTRERTFTDTKHTRREDTLHNI